MSTQIHMPSLHARFADGSGFDYEENLELDGSVRPGLSGGPREVAEWAINDLADRNGLSDAEVALVLGSIQFAVAEAQAARRAAAGERRCAKCGCSNSHACPGGCVWATDTLCSRCV
jgi:hypothetical protein